MKNIDEKLIGTVKVLAGLVIASATIGMAIFLWNVLSLIWPW